MRLKMSRGGLRRMFNADERILEEEGSVGFGLGEDEVGSWVIVAGVMVEVVGRWL